MADETADMIQAPEPRANPFFTGHEAAERRLLDAWLSGRLPHGWLITGPAGIGKATLAFRFARYALASGHSENALLDLMDPQAAASLDFDPDDALFRRVAAGGHPDLMTLERGYDAAGKRRRNVIVIENVRAATSFLSLTASEGGWRVVIVDSADDLNRNSANALLKTLEEPPKNTLILLVSHRPDRLPSTIRSRCCRLTLAPLSDDRVVVLMGRYMPELATNEAAALARLADGSIGRALRLAESGGLMLHQQIQALLRPMPRADTEAVHQFADLLARRDAEPMYRASADLLRWWIWRIVRYQSTREEPERGDGTADMAGEYDCIQHLAALSSLDQWVEVWDKIGRLFGQADGINLDRKQVVLNAFQHIARAADA